MAVPLVAVFVPLLAANWQSSTTGPWADTLARLAMSDVGVQIVRPVTGKWKREERKLLSLPEPLAHKPKVWPIYTTEFEVLRSDTPSPRRTITIDFTQPQSYEAPREVKPGNYLLVTKAAFGRRLLITSGSSAEFWQVTVETNSPDEKAGLLLIPTPATTLRTNLSGPDLVTASILDTVVPGQPSTYATAAKLLGTAHPEWSGRANAIPSYMRHAQFLGITEWQSAGTTYCPPGPLPTLLADMLKACRSEYERSRILEMAVRWRVPGHFWAYLDSMTLLLSDPGAYRDERVGENNWGPIIDYWQYLPVDGPQPGPRKYNDVQLANAKNPVLLAYWLEYFAGPHSVAVMVGLLDYPDEYCRFLAAKDLSIRLDEPDKLPRQYDSVNGKTVEYPHLDEIIHYWKKRFGVL